MVGKEEEEEEVKRKEKRRARIEGRKAAGTTNGKRERGRREEISKEMKVYKRERKLRK